MNIILFTNQGSLPGKYCLEALLQKKLNVVALVEPEPKGSAAAKGPLKSLRKLLKPLKGNKDTLEALAEGNSIRVLCAKNINAPEFLEQVAALKPDIFIIAGINQILKKEIISMPKYCINVHPSFLPKYRGVKPFFWALFNSEPELGATVHFVAERVDAGDIIEQGRIDVTNMKDVKEIRDRLFELEGRLCGDAVAELIDNSFKRIKQDEAQASSAPEPTPEQVKEFYGRMKARSIKNADFAF
jgi:methionyl-tRNA formyltransferase